MTCGRKNSEKGSKKADFMPMVKVVGQTGNFNRNKISVGIARAFTPAITGFPLSHRALLVFFDRTR